MVRQNYTQMRIYVEESTSTSLQWINDLENRMFNDMLLMLIYLGLFGTMSLSTLKKLILVIETFPSEFERLG